MNSADSDSRSAGWLAGWLADARRLPDVILQDLVDPVQLYHAS